jgi:Fumarase C C-terminus
VIGYDKASKIAHYAMDHDLTLKAAALQLGFVSEEEFNRVLDPAKMVRPRRDGIRMTVASASKATAMEEAAHLSLKLGRLLLRSGADTAPVHDAVLCDPQMQPGRC